MLGISPKGKQKQVMALPAKGHLVVLGTAGSGKTTIALLRAEHLACIPNSGKVLLVTFNRALVQYMRDMESSLPSNLSIENYHQFARGYLKSRGKLPEWNGILKSEGKRNLIEQALALCKLKYPNETTFKRPLSFFIDEIIFIQNFGFGSFEEYYKAERIGRSSANIKRENRKWIYEVYEKYISLRKVSGRLYDWDDLAYYVWRELQEDKSQRMYSHIILDEGQDFSPTMIKSLVSATASNGSFTFFGDVSQQIYGSRLSWRDSGISAEKIWRFDVNYRNPESITAFASDIMKSEYWQKSEDTVNSVESIAKGPKPALLRFVNAASESKWVIDRALATGKNSSTVIILRRRADIDWFFSQLLKRGCKAVKIDKDLPDHVQNKTVYLTTFHAAKGLEFENVFIPYLSAKDFPDGEAYNELPDTSDVFANELKLFYVAVTRSKYGLYMTYTDKLSQLVPNDSSNCDYFDMEEEAI